MNQELLRQKLGTQYAKLENLSNDHVNEFITKYIELCNPDSVFVCDNSEADLKYIRAKALEQKEEIALKTPGHTIHFDGYFDQARDAENTRYLLEEGQDLGSLRSIGKKEGLEQVLGFLKDSMVGRQMIVAFFTLGPSDSVFSQACLQITDSFYVTHSETILYRGGYSQFKKLNGSNDFFKFIHSAGVLENAVCKDVAKRRVYMDLNENTVYSTNTQYAGNTVGLKKLALRLAINKACSEDWLAEHMFVMGSKGPNGRKTYFTGAFPSACGKTSTSMMAGESIVGDDIAYLRVIDGKVRAVNVEKGIFGIISDVNSTDDPVIYNALTSPREVIFSNILYDDEGMTYWSGKDGECPMKGINHSGEWVKGKKDAKGNEIPPSHKNARYTIAIDELDNKDEALDDPNGVEVSGIVYGGRDSNTTVPVEESFDWEHGIITKAAILESETTSATLGQEGVRKFCAMSNIEFVAVTLGKYMTANLDFPKKAVKKPIIFSVNYFLKDEKGNFLNGKQDKRIWMKWMEGRCHGDFDAIKTPTGYIPYYEDLAALFKQVLDKVYTREDYERQFKIRILELLAKTDRVEVIYREKVSDTPKIFFDTLDAQRRRLEAAKELFGDFISPKRFAK